MKTLELTQGSSEWKAARQQYFTASEAAAMIGECSHTSRTELLSLKTTGIEKEINDYVEKFVFKKGHETEALARPIIENRLGEELFPVVGCCEIDGLNLLASYDGLTMMENIVFEHKQWNESLAEEVKNGNIPKPYPWQLEQLLLVSGADKAIFVVSDGTEDNMVSAEYVSNPEKREKLIAGWKQFKNDMENYVPMAIKEKPQAEPIKSLPALSVQIKDEVAFSNLPEFKAAALEFIGNINTDLKTDQDFADAEQTIKFCQNAENDLDHAKKSAIAQTASIDELMRTIEHISEALRSKRLTLNKLVKDQKVAIKNEIVHKGISGFTSHIDTLNAEIRPVTLQLSRPDFAGAIKGKRTLSSIQDAVDTTLANAKIEADRQAGVIRNNLAVLRENEKYRFLFNDISSIALKPADDFKTLVNLRISEHKEAEARRLEAERERIRQEEQRRADEEKRRELARIEAEKRNEAEKRQKIEEQIRLEDEKKCRIVEEKIDQYKANKPEKTQPSEEPIIFPDPEDTINIPVSEYEKLKNDSRILNCLINAGVQNWEWYEDALAEA